MFDQDNVLASNEDEDDVLISDEEADKLDISLDSSEDDYRPPSPPISTSQRYKKRQRTKKDRLKAVAAVSARKKSKNN